MLHGISSLWFSYICAIGCPFFINGLISSSSSISSAFVMSIPSLELFNVSRYSWCAQLALYRYLSYLHVADFSHALQTYGALCSIGQTYGLYASHRVIHLWHFLHWILQWYPFFLLHRFLFLHVSLYLQSFTLL